VIKVDKSGKENFTKRKLEELDLGRCNLRQ
jgi:hypothetical protein